MLYCPVSRVILYIIGQQTQSAVQGSSEAEVGLIMFFGLVTDVSVVFFFFNAAKRRNNCSAVVDGMLLLSFE